MKKLFTFLLITATCVGTICAKKVQINGLYYNLDATSQTAEVTYQNSYNPHWSSIITTADIPASVTYKDVTYSVTSIGDYAFADCTGLTSATIPNSVVSIGEAVFANCTALTSVTIPNSVTSIEYCAFSGCKSLTSVTIPNSVTSIGGYAFAGCTGLTSVTIPNSVTSIKYWAFYGCTGLTSVTIGNSVTSIGDGAFYGCTGLTSVTIGNSVTSIGNYAFYECTGLTSIEIPNSVTSISEGAFYNCTGLTSVTIGNSVTNIGYDAFYGCTGLTSVVWNAKNCNKYNFGSQISSFTFGNEVEVIPAGLCQEMNMLTSVTIPNSVTSIGGGAFSGCTGLTSVTINSNAIMSSYSMQDLFGSQVTNYIIGDSVTSIGDYAFRGCTGLTSPVYNAHVFAYLPTSYTGSYIIPDGIVSIAGGSFAGCTGLTSVTIPNSVTSIGDYAFSGCTGLTSPVYNAHVFAYLPTSYTGSYVIPEGIESIAGGSFAGCTGLNSIEIPQNVTNIGGNAFKGCSSLTTVVWAAKNYPDIASDEKSPFYNVREQITTFSFSNTVEHIPAYLCYEMIQLSSVEIPRGCVSIGNRAFFNCDNIFFISLPSTLTTIGNWAFSTQKIFKVYNYSITPQDMSSYSGSEFFFRGILATAKLYVPAESIETYSNTYFWCYFGSIEPLQSPESTSIDQVYDKEGSSQNGKGTKLLHNGQILILRGDKTYTLQGQEVK